MKRKNNRTYQTPGVSMTNLVMEGILCFSALGSPEADELHNINGDESSDPEPMYFDV